ncbi:MAG: HEAT repeat domain-containing protein [Nitrososphaerales archaeon]
MKANWLRTLATRPALRIGLAVLLILIGLAPIGQPILSDSSWRASAAPAAQAPVTPEPQAFTYRVVAQSDAAQGNNGAQVERSDDGGKTWHAVANVPEKVAEIMAVPGNEQVVYARTANGLWVSRDGGASWAHAGQLPSRPLALAVTSNAAGAVFVGTESVGLAVSRDGGETWQVVNDATINMDGAAPVAVTALKVNPHDDSIIYATTGVWTGTSEARLTPQGVFVSVDGGRVWLQMDQLPMNQGQATAIQAVEGRPLAVTVENSKGSLPLEMKMSPELTNELNSEDPAIRASVAKVLGLLGDKTAVQPLLDHLNDPDVLAGDRVAEALGRLGDNSIVPALMQALNSDQEAVRARAAYALGLLKDEAAVGALAEHLRSDQGMVANRAAEALANIGTPAALKALTVPLADVELTPAQHAAMAGLEKAGKQATQPLVASLQSQNPALRAHAAEMLGYIKPDNAVQPLASALNDNDPTVRTQAAWALGEIATPDAQNALARAARQATDQTTRTAVLSAQQQARVATVGSQPTEAFGDGIVAALSSIPATRWTFFGLFLALALALLLLAPRVEHVQTRR